MLSELQRHLNDIYQVGSAYDVRDFLITDERLARLIAGQAMLSSTSETLLMAEDEDGMGVSLFLERELIDRLESANPFEALAPHQLDDLWKVIEGLSHFNCFVWKASQDRCVSLLELELQAEIDKFVATMQLAIDHRETDMLNRLHGWLFDDVSYRDELTAEELDRYRDANEYAARFCRTLRRRLLNGDGRARDELRRFYRLQLADKISHIHSSAFGRA